MQNAEKDLQERTKRFALNIIRTFSMIPKTTEAQVLGKQFAAFRDVGRSKLSRSTSRAQQSGVHLKVR
jgi:hypothetical protein